MSRGKGQSTEPTQGIREVHRWSEHMDTIMLNEFVEQERKGNRHDGNWSTEAYDHVVNSFRSAGYVDLTKQHIKNRMKTIKDCWREAYDLFNSLSGFAWNPITKRFEAEEEVWEGFIREKPHASRWRTMQIRNYDIMKDLFGTDRATGGNAWSACGDTSMHDQEGPVGEDTQQSAPNVESFSPANGQSNQSTGTPSSRGTKRKAPMVDLLEAQMERLSSGLGLVADALNTGNAISEKLHDVAERQVSVVERQAAAVEKRNDIIERTRPRIYSESDVWDMLTEINVMEQYRFKMVGSSSKRLRNGKSKKVPTKNTKKPSSGSKKTTMEGSTQQPSKKARPIVEPRFIDLDFFHSNGFEFPNLIEYQGLKHFVSIECKYLVELVKVFYSNLTIANEDLLSEVKNVKIRVRPSDWLAIVGLKYEGEKFDTTKIRSWENYNRTKAVRYDNLEGEVNVDWSNRFDKRTLNKMKIIQFNGVWQYAHEGVVAPNDEVEEPAAAPAEPGSLSQGYQVGEQPSQSIHMEDMIKYIYSTLHNIEHSLANLSNYVGDLNSKMEKKFDELGMRMKVVEDQLAQGPPINDHNV
ncbi:Myb/SANT-like domain [Sesbania bispinosa]|nr:Myb/SANT-like domain [Sesbania bispinosa]